MRCWLYFMVKGGAKQFFECSTEMEADAKREKWKTLHSSTQEYVSPVFIASGIEDAHETAERQYPHD